jgi:hypothetical protein
VSKSNKYKINYFYNGENRVFYWRITIKKLNLTMRYNPNGKHFAYSAFNVLKKCKTLNNFIIEPNLITMITSTDRLSQNVAFEILNNRLNDRTKQNTI